MSLKKAGKQPVKQFSALPISHSPINHNLFISSDSVCRIVSPLYGTFTFSFMLYYVFKRPIDSTKRSDWVDCLLHCLTGIGAVRSIGCAHVQLSFEQIGTATPNMRDDRPFNSCGSCIFRPSAIVTKATPLSCLARPIASRGCHLFMVLELVGCAFKCRLQSEERDNREKKN